MILFGIALFCTADTRTRQNACAPEFAHIYHYLRDKATPIKIL